MGTNIFFFISFLIFSVIKFHHIFSVGERDSEVERAEEEEDDDDDEIYGSDESESRKVQPAMLASAFVAKDGTVWKKTPPIHHQTPVHNIVREKSGPHKATLTLSIRDTFKCIFTNEIVDIIVRYTNQKAKSVYDKYNRDNPTKKQLTWMNVTAREFDAFVGVLITSGVNNSNTDHTRDMWKPNSYPLYRASMSLNRFWNILRFIRFDNEKTRTERLQSDKAAAIRDVWIMLNQNLVKNYRPTENLTVDEQLFPYRGRTRFTQYIPSKPAKYGIKVWWVCDAKNFYPLTGQIYTGKTGTSREINQGERVVKDLVVTYKKSGRNITMDNFFTSLPLAKHLLSWNLTIVGTLKRNKSYIPQEMAPCKSRQVLSSLFGFHDEVTICSYVPKKQKAVTLISTFHHDATITEMKEKPEIVHFYNETKSGVDEMDKLLRRYTTQRRTNRWPLAFFFNIVDIASLAAYIIYMANNDMLNRRTSDRRIFLRSLGEELSLPAIEDRALNVQAMRHFSARSGVESILKKSLIVPNVSENSGSTSQPPPRDATGRKKVVGVCKMCFTAPENRRRKTRKACQTCKNPVCDEHSYTFCRCKDCPNM